jgi:hypothetical protein
VTDCKLTEARRASRASCSIDIIEMRVLVKRRLKREWKRRKGGEKEKQVMISFSGFQTPTWSKLVIISERASVGI